MSGFFQKEIANSVSDNVESYQIKPTPHFDRANRDFAPKIRGSSKISLLGAETT
jgi:hypothetical protein